MDIHINKKIAGLMLTSLLAGGAIGGVLGFVGGSEEGGHYERGGYEKGEQNGYDNNSDGEFLDDRDGAPNVDKQVNKNAPAIIQNGASTTSSTIKTQ